MVEPDTGTVVDSADIRRAYETDEGELVILEADDLEKVTPTPSREIRVTQFVPPEEITHQWYDRPYFLGPDAQDDAYFALAAALRKRGVEGVAQWVMRNKEYVGALRAEGDYLMLITLRHAGEIVPASALPAPTGRALDDREIAMAKQLVKAMEDPFDITAFHDEYRERVLELVQARAAGKVVRFPKAARKQTETSLADVLEASLAASGGKERKRA
jgi:DNA end-binding protein Ku